MPNIITHTIFSDDVLEGLSRADQDLIRPRMKLYHIGANGPDFLFFAGLDHLRYQQGKPLRKAGGRLHGGHVNEFYASALESVLEQKNPAIADDMKAYLCGHLCHWALDSTAHPYIFYKTGRGDSESAWRHHAMESLLDAIVLKVKRSQTIETFHFPDIAEADLPSARAVARVYVPALRDVFGMNVHGHEIKQALDGWHFAQGAFFDASGGKRSALRGIEKLTGTENLASGLLVPAEIEDNWDVCNLQHKEWQHPCLPEEVHTESFFDLLDLAVVRARTAIQLFLAACANEQDVPVFLQYLDGKAYDTGLNEKLPMEHFGILDFKF